MTRFKENLLIRHEGINSMFLFKRTVSGASILDRKLLLAFILYSFNWNKGNHVLIFFLFLNIEALECTS